MYNINFKLSKQTEHAEFAPGDGETLLDKLEEVLYTLWELTPATREWREDMRTHSATKFLYCDVSHTVAYDCETKTFNVTEDEVDMTEAQFVQKYIENAGFDWFLNHLDCNHCPLKAICGVDSERDPVDMNCSDYIKSKLKK